MSKKHVVVIGAGLGGIAAAARLAQSGYKVTVLEKNERPGGRCDQIVRDGHRFDLGPTLFLMPEVFAQTYRDLGEDMYAHLDLLRIDPTYRIRFEDGSRLALTSDMHAMREQIEAFEVGSFDAMLRYLQEGNLNYHESLKRFVGRNFYSLWEYFSLANLPYLFRLKALQKHYTNVGRYFDDPRLKSAFTFQNMYLGLSPYDAPATYSLLQYTEMVGGVWFPRGGLYRVIEDLVSIAERRGVEFVYSTPVERIETQDGHAVAVRTKDGQRIPADLVLANADLPYVYDRLLGDARAARLKDLNYTCSAITFYWGMQREFPELDVHNIYLSSDYRRSFERIFDEHGLPEVPSVYVHAPKRCDPSSAPGDGDTLMALVPVGHISNNGSGEQDWKQLVGRARKAVIDWLKADGVQGFEEALKFEIAFSAPTWQQRYNLEKGAAFGLSHDFWQVGALRPANRHPRYGNLYFVGSSTHPGTGLPMVLLSARLVCERILKEGAG